MGNSSIKSASRLRAGRAIRGQFPTLVAASEEALEKPSDVEFQIPPTCCWPSCSSCNSQTPSAFHRVFSCACGSGGFAVLEPPRFVEISNSPNSHSRDFENLHRAEPRSRWAYAHDSHFSYRTYGDYCSYIENALTKNTL